MEQQKIDDQLRLSQLDKEIDHLNVELDRSAPDQEIDILVTIDKLLKAGQEYLIIFKRLKINTASMEQVIRDIEEKKEKYLVYANLKDK